MAPCRKAPREVELKLELEPDEAQALRRHPLLRDVESRTERLNTVYFDTQVFALRKAGLSLRVRHVGNRRVQTIKAASGAAAGLFDRNEWEQDIAGEGPDLGAAAGTALEPLLADPQIRGAIRPLFAVEAERETFQLVSPAWVAELTLDEGTVRADGRTEALCEAELELRRGDAGDLFGIARTLSETVPVRLGIRTKAERGYALVENKPPKAVKAADPGLKPGMTTAEAFQAIGRACLTQFLANERILRASRDPNVVHQMRVALRRLRAAISLFRDVVADEQRDAVKDELRWISGQLGAARDLDVFIEKVLEPVMEQHRSEAGLDELARRYERDRNLAYDRVVEALATPRFRRLVIDTAAWIETGPWLTRGGEGAAKRRRQPIEVYAAAELGRRRKRVKRRGADLKAIDAHARHQVRIEVKKLRYAVEFFGPLYMDDRAVRRRKSFQAALEDLQEHLGDLNDVAVSQGMSATEGGPAEDGPMRLIARHQASRGDAALEPALEAYGAFADARRFWG